MAASPEYSSQMICLKYGLKKHKIMKVKQSSLIFFAFFLFTFTNLSAQEHAAGSMGSSEHSFKHFRTGLAMYHTYIRTETSGNKKYLIVPSLGLDVEYWFNEKWGLGSHNDLELISFEVEEAGHMSIERESPLMLTLDALWKPYKGFVFLLGPGIEFEKTDNLFVVRGGIEYEIELKKMHWDIAPTIFYDRRMDAYDTFSVGIGIGKRF